MKLSLPLNWLELNEAFPATQLTGSLMKLSLPLNWLELNEAFPATQLTGA